MFTRCISLLFLATFVLADYYVDNANTSVVYAMAPSSSGQAWQTFSVNTQALELNITNSTGSYIILLDASNCYDQNYALGVCGTGDNCYVQIPFTGSGINMYVFNAGLSGMTASFSVDGSAAVSSSVQTPPPPDYQVSNVSLFSIQGLPSGNHTMVMTVLDWDGSPTSMKFDYAHINETFVATPTTTTSSPSTTTSTPTSSQTSTQTSAGSNSVSNGPNIGAIIGGTLGGIAILVCAVIGFIYMRKKKAMRQDKDSLPQPAFHVDPFVTAPSASQRSLFVGASVAPLQRTAILRNAHAAGSSMEPVQDTIRSELSSPSPALQPLRRQPSYGGTERGRSSMSDSLGSPVGDSGRDLHPNLTPEQLEVVERLRVDNVPEKTIARVVEGFASASSRLSTVGASSLRAPTVYSTAPPPSYQSRDR